MSCFTEGKTSEVCFACGKPIEERDAPPQIGTFQKVGKYTIRRQAWDDKWEPITEDTFFHEECYYKGFVMAVKHGFLTWQQKEAYKNLYQGRVETIGNPQPLESLRRDYGVDHT